MFERNFFKESAVCPKCGSNNPAPKYIPEDWSFYRQQILFNTSPLLSIEKNLALIDLIDKDKYIILDKTVCLCRCGYEWQAEAK